MRTSVMALVVGAAFLVLSSQARGEPVRFVFEGVVSEVDVIGPGVIEPFGGSITVGMAVTGSFSWDTSSPPSERPGDYLPAPDLFGVCVSLGEYTVCSTTDYYVSLFRGHLEREWILIYARQYAVVKGPGPVNDRGGIWFVLRWPGVGRLFDDPGDGLPDSFPPLSEATRLSTDFQAEWIVPDPEEPGNVVEDGAAILWTLTSLKRQAIPEPSTLILVGLGVLAVVRSRRRKNAA